MKQQIKGKGTIFYENGTWNIIIKSVNFNNYTIEYLNKSGFSTYKEAEKAANQAEENYKTQIARVKKLTNIRYTFLEYIDYWYQKIYLPDAVSSIKVGYCWTIYSIIMPNAKKDILLGMVSSTYLNELLESCAGYCQSAGAMAGKIIRVALKDAIDDGYLKGNPLTGMKKFHWNPPKLVIYSKEQLRVLLQAAYEYHTIYLEVLLALFAGLRKGEIMGLNFSDFNEDKQTVKIERQITRNYEVIVKNSQSYKVITSEQSTKPPKSFNSYRTLKINRIIFEELKIRKQENEELFKKLPEEAQSWKGYVCVGPKGNIKSDGTCNGGLERICLRNGLPKVTMHDLRHMFATILIEQDVPLDKISKLMGHKSVATTFEIYCGIIGANQEIAKTIDGTLDPINAAGNL